MENEEINNMGKPQNLTTESDIANIQHTLYDVKTLIIPLEKLGNSNRLEFIIAHGDNYYYHVLGTNKSIMHVSKGRCVIMDYKVTPYNNGIDCILPIMLSAYKYGAYQKWQNTKCRDWIKRTDGSNITISNDIYRIITGYTREQAKIDGYTLHHKAETYNEQFKNLEYCVDKERYSHRRSFFVKDDRDLDYLIDLIEEDDRHDESRFLDDK